MKCPLCGHENKAGDTQCAFCFSPFQNTMQEHPGAAPASARPAARREVPGAGEKKHPALWLAAAVATLIGVLFLLLPSFNGNFVEVNDRNFSTEVTGVKDRAVLVWFTGDDPGVMPTVLRHLAGRKSRMKFCRYRADEGTSMENLSNNHMIYVNGQIVFAGTGTGVEDPDLGEIILFMQCMKYLYPDFHAGTGAGREALTIFGSEFNERVLAAKRPAIVAFTSRGDGASNRFASQFRETARAFNAVADFYFLEDSTEYNQRYAISSVPTVVTFRDGKEIARFVVKDEQRAAIKARIIEPVYPDVLKLALATVADN